VVVLLPSLAWAQASISGTVRDTSGAVLPGVTVEAASPVLIEKVRSAVTDGNGRYQIIDLRPGAYTVTFTLTGFNTVKREGVTLAGASEAGIDVELRVGALEETITVTGEAPIVDTSTVTRQAVLSADTIDALPTARNYVTLARLIPAAVGGGTDVGGANLQGVGGSVTVHGSRPTDQRVTLNGINTMTLQAGGNMGGQIPDVGSAAEMTVESTGVSAELPTGGVRINFIPRDGGNRFSDSTFFTVSHDNLQGSNFNQDLRTAGLGTPNEIQKNWDLNQSFGGPFKRDQVWFWGSLRYNGIENRAPVFNNLNAYQPTQFAYVPDTSTAGLLKGRSYNSSLRVTYQATPKLKIAGTYKTDTWCDCPNGITALVAPEAARDFRFPRLRQEHAEFTMPVTNRILIDGVFMHLFERWGFMHPQQDARMASSQDIDTALAAQMISITEQSTGLVYRAPAATNNNTLVPNYAYRASVSYVTGSHNVKVGFNRTHGFQNTRTYNLNNIAYQTNGGVAGAAAAGLPTGSLLGTPNQLTLRAYPITLQNNLDNDLGLYVQDRWRLNRATIGLAIRYDTFQASFPEQVIGAAQYAPTRNIVFPAQDNLNWNDLTYRTSFTYDLAGDGRTAFKATANKYLLGQTLNGIGGDPNPVNTMSNTTNRAWTDNNGNWVPDCDLLNPAAQSPATTGSVDTCGPWANPTFGRSNPTSTFSDELRSGFNNRPSNWEFSVGVQRAILPRLSVDVGWFRRVWSNFRVTDNLALAATDFDTFSMTIPADARIPGGGGQRLEGLVALKPEAFGRLANNFNTLDRVYGQQKEHWNGVDVNVDARLGGLTLQAGTSTGRTTEDDCDIMSKLPEFQTVFLGGVIALRPAQFCRRLTPWLTQLKGYAVYTVPKVDVQVSGTFRSVPGDVLRLQFNASNAYLAANSTLGRPLAGGVPNLAIDILEPNAVYLPRRNELDMRFGKVIRAGRTRSVVSIDMFNALNSNVVITGNQNFGAVNRVNGADFVPTSILGARTFKFSWQFDL
jgi:hypothetical protein